MHVVFIVACLAYSIIQYFQISELLTSCHLTIAFLPTNTLDFTNTECNVGNDVCSSLYFLIFF